MSTCAHVDWLPYCGALRDLAMRGSWCRCACDHTPCHAEAFFSRSATCDACLCCAHAVTPPRACRGWHDHSAPRRSEEHTSELQSLTNLVCRLLLEKKKTTKKYTCTI